MKTVKTGVFSRKYFFSLNEREKFLAYKKKFQGFFEEIFINNGYCIEVTKRNLY